MNFQPVKNFSLWAREHPLEYARQVHGFEPWQGEGDDQKDLYLAACNGHQTIASTANAVGKTTSMAMAAIRNFVAYHPDIRIINTAPTWHQVVGVFWPEIHKFVTEANIRTGGVFSKLFGNPLQHEWKSLMSPSCYMTGLSPHSAEALQGRHEKNIKIYIDEGVGVRDDIYTGVEGLLSGGNASCFIATNPMLREGGAWSAWRDPDFENLTISAFKHPNVVRQEIVIPGMVTYEWVEKMQRRCAKEMVSGDYNDHPEYQARVLGIWPEEGAAQVLVPYGWFEKARQVKKTPEGEKAAGLDVARAGDDNTVLSWRIGGELQEIHKWHGLLTQDVVGKVTEVLRQHGIKKVVVDLGYNPGVADMLPEDLDVQGINFGGKAYECDEFENQITEIAWFFREGVQDGNVWFKDIPYLDELADDMQRYYVYTSKVKKKLEPKDQFKKRIGRSPDVGDSVVLCYWEEGVSMPVFM